MSSDNSDEIDGEHLSDADSIYSVDGDPALPLKEVTTTIADAAQADLRLEGSEFAPTDLTVHPVREPSVTEDVMIGFQRGPAHIQLTLGEDDALALIDAVRQALEVPKFDE